MNTFCKSIFPVIYILSSCLKVDGQETHSTKEPFSRHHSLSLLLGHTQTSQGSQDGKKQWISLPSWALDYNYHFSRRWSVGLHNDIILESFKVEDHNTHQEIIERTRPIATIAIISYTFLESFSAEFGAGAEYAKEGTFYLNRLGLEYAYELPHAWELKGAVTYDMKWEAYNSFSLSVGIGKAFGFRKSKGSHSE
jgi:hypothetical protein